MCIAAYGGDRPLALGWGPLSGGLAGEGTPGAGLEGGGPTGGGRVGEGPLGGVLGGGGRLRWVLEIGAPPGGGMKDGGPPGEGLEGGSPLGEPATAESLMAEVWADLTAAEGLLVENGKLCGGFTAGCHTGKSRSEADVAGSTGAEEDPVLNVGPRDPCMRQQA